MKNYHIILLTFYIISLSSCSGSSVSHEAHVIDVEAAVGTGAIQNASEYIEEFTYIPLETVPGSLIGTFIRNVLVENGKIYIHNASDIAGRVTIFDMDGRYISTLYKNGRGPGEYFSTHDVDITPSGNILVMTRGGEGTFEYDHDFKFIRQLRPKEDADAHILLSGWNYDDIVVLKEGLYALNAGDIDFKAQTEKRIFIIYDNSQETHFYEEIIREDKEDERLYYTRGYIQYLQDNQLSIYRAETDSIFAIDFENGYSKSLRYIFNLGKYGPKMSLKDAPSEKEYLKANSNSILIKKILETNSHIFVEFNFNGFAPEPITTQSRTITRANGMTQTMPSYKDNRVYGIYDKREGKVALLNQPIPGMLGLKNDLDGGPPIFWPMYITSKKEMIRYYTAMEVVDMIEQGKVDKDLFGNIRENDNPVIVIAKEK